MKIIQPIVDWIAGARWRKSASHLLTMWPWWITGFLLFRSTAVAALSVIVYFWSRKITEYEFSIKDSASTVTVWNKGFFPWEWSLWLQIDLYIPAVASLLIWVATVNKLT